MVVFVVLLNLDLDQIFSNFISIKVDPLDLLLGGKKCKTA